MPTSTPTLDDLRDVLHGLDRGQDGRPSGGSAVLVPLYGSPPDLQLLLTRRHRDLERHPGEVSFPGGRIDPGDRDATAAALREAREEVGIRAEDVDVLGHLADFRTFYGALVHAYVGHVAGDPPGEPTSPAEVEEILVYPLGDFLSDRYYEGRHHPGEEDPHVVHYWHFPDAVVWGITGELIQRLLRRGWGWAPPREPHPITTWEGFRPDEGDPPERHK